ncbi:hypothetical protein, partial [Umezakia ovalisporum]|uniref:hypothetical protein n=1 Tax=Umezakia ovalisporum TaxID=75695 RepID=UPI0039C5FD17
MKVIEKHKVELTENGYTIIDKIYSEKEIEKILLVIDQAEKNKETFRKSADLFAIRQFFKEIPEAERLVFNDNLKNVVYQLLG